MTIPASLLPVAGRVRTRPRDAGVGTHRATLAGLVILGLGLRLAVLGGHGIRLDEVFTLWVARQSPGDILAALTEIDTHPPLHYAIAHLWSMLGDHPVWMRLPSAMFGAATIPVIHRIAATVAGRRAGLYAAGLLAVSPWHVWHAQDARGYTLLTLGLSLSVLGAVQVLAAGEGPQARRGAWLHAVGGAVAILTHNVAVVAVAAVGASTAIAQRRGASPSTAWTRANLALAVVLLAWLPGLVRQVLNVDQNLAWAAEEATARLMVATPLSGWLSTATVEGWGWLALDVLVLGLVVIGARRLLRRRHPAFAVLLAAWLVLPVLEIVLHPWLPVFVGRTLLATSVPLIVLVATALAGSGKSPRLLRTRLVAGGALGVIAVAGVASDHASPHRPWETVAGRLADEVGADDLVVYLFNVSQLAVDGAADVAGRSMALPGDFEARRVWDEAVTTGSLERLAAVAATHPKVWLVSVHADRMDPGDRVPALLRSQHLTLSGCVDYDGVEVSRYERAPPLTVDACT